MQKLHVKVKTKAALLLHTVVLCERQLLLHIPRHVLKGINCYKIYEMVTSISYMVNLYYMDCYQTNEQYKICLRVNTVTRFNKERAAQFTTGIFYHNRARAHNSQTTVRTRFLKLPMAYH